MKKKKIKPFRIIFNYLKDDRLKTITYCLLVILTYVPVLLTSFFWGFAIEGLIEHDLNKFLFFVIFREIVHIILYTLLSFPRDYLYNLLQIKFTKNVVKDMYSKIQDLPAIAFEEIGVGEFINKLTTDPDRVMELLRKLMKMTCRSFVIVLIMIVALSSSLLLGIEIIIFGIVMGFISAKFFPKIKKTQERIKKESDLQVKTTTENLTGIREIKALGVKDNIKERLYDNIDTLFEYERKQCLNENIYSNLNNLIYFILQGIILATAGYYVYTGKITYSIFVVIEAYIWRINEIVESISDFGINYNKVKVSLRRIDEIVNNRLYNDESFGNVELENTKGIIEFKNVNFKYRDDEDYTLKNFSIKIEPNKKVAIVGRSGNGKSTIFNLLLRYFDATEGNIYIDGINIKELTEKSLRNNISIIRQSPFLFNLSIMDNFRIVKKDITLEEVRKVCKEAYIDDYIMSLPRKYETIIGEGGVNLSGGQKQRIAIARTLLVNTKVILFDEATSALDNESQEYIKKTINNLVKNHTIIIVAHRLSTIVDADVINIIDKGQLVATGSHKELLKGCDIYKTLYNIEEYL